MRRIEPTIGDTRFSTDAESERQRRRRASPRRAQDANLDLLGSLLLVVFAIAACAAAAIYAGIVPAQLQLGTPRLFERLCILLGLAVALAAQAIGYLLLFRRSFVQGGLSLFLPGYVFFALARAGLYRPVIGTWCAGLLAIVAGTVLLT